MSIQLEQEIWAFQREMKPSFVINSVLPCFVVGPILHEKQKGSTGKLVMDFWKDPSHYKFLQDFSASWYIDVRDTALLHITTLIQEEIKNERLLSFADTFNFNSWIDVFRRLDSGKPWPVEDITQKSDLSKLMTRGN